MTCDVCLLAPNDCKCPWCEYCGRSLRDGVRDFVSLTREDGVKVPVCIECAELVLDTLIKRQRERLQAARGSNG